MYLVTLLNQPALQAKITGVAFGAAQPNVSPSAMGNIIVPLPPISLQLKFADFVRSIFAMRAQADNSSYLTLSVSGALSAELM